MLKNKVFAIAIFFLLSFASGFAENYLFNASYVVSYYYDDATSSFNSCTTLIDCISSDGNGYASITPDKTLGIYYYAYIKTKTNASLPHDISVLDVQACVKAYRNYDFNANCYIIAMENSSGVWEEEYWKFDCNEYPVSSFGIKCINATDFFNLTKLNNSGVGWGISYISTGKDYRTMTLDWFYLNVSYIPLQFLVWQSNATTLLRGQSAEISAKWQIKDIAVAKIRHNLSGSFQEYSITPEYPWTNYTVVFNNSIAPGYYEISYIYAQDSYGGYNKTFPSIGLTLYGYARVSEIIVNDSYIYPGEGVKVFCKVIDANTSENLANYPVNFYLDNNLLGVNYTNSSGFAVMEFNLSSIGLHEIKCNITDNTGLYYVIAENEKSTEIKVLNLSVVINLNSTSLEYGNAVLVKANITNASSIVSAELNHSFVNITDDCLLEDVSVIRDMEIVKCYYPDLCEAEISFIPERSGTQNLTLCVNASSPFGVACNTSSFSVSFGEVSSVFWIPYYFVLANQTFNITVNVSSSKGDVWNVNVTLSIDGQESINISSSESWWKIVSGVKSSGTCLVTFSAYSNNTGLVKMSLNSLPENGTASRFSESFEVIEPEINRNSNISFAPQSIFIDEFTIIKANIIGNASPCEVNFTVFKPWNSGNKSFYYQKVEALDPEMCGIVFESGNIASLAKGADASASADSNETAIYAIDEDNSTAWSWGEASHINITFKKPDYTVERIELRWKKLVSGEVNASIYYIDPMGNLNIFVENIPLPSSVNETIFSDFKPFKAGKIILNFTGGASVYEVRVYPTVPRSDKCYVFSVNFTSENLTYSGYYNTFASIITQTGDLINLKNASFFVKYGKPVLEISSYTPEGMIIGNPEKYIVIVKAYRGDLRNFTLRWNSSDLSYLNITSDETFMKNFTFLENGNSTEVVWIVNATGIPKERYSNYTVETHVNAFSELGRIRENSNISFNITIYPEDNEAPVINSFWFEIKGVKTNITNVNFTLSIIANVTDNIWVRYVNATIIYPNGYNTSVKLRKISDNIWNFTFTIDGIELNQTGNYSIRIEATDLEYNETLSNFSEINVSNKLYIFIESPILLNRGEYLNLSVRDVNNLTVEYAMFNFSAKAMNSNFTLSNSSQTTFFTLFINSTYPADDYETNVTAKIYNNTGYLNFTFRVSSELIIEIIAPAENAVFEPGEAISGVDLPRIKVYNIRKDKEIVSNVSVNVTCLDSNSDSKTHEINYGACGIFEDTFSFSGCEAKCYAPNTYGSTFYITFTAKNVFNNSGVNSVALKTKSPPSSEEKVISAGGGGGGGALPPVCNCTEWKNIGCGIGFCGIEEMYQERVCSPSNCSIEARCIKHVLCIIPTDFQVTYLNTTSEIIKGYEKTFYLIISNLVEKEIEINASIEAEGCEVIYEKTIVLEPKMEKLYEIKVTPFLNASGYSTLKFEFSSGNVTKEGSIELVVKENPVVSKINEIKEKVEKEFLQKVSYLKEVGINTKDVEKKISEVKKLTRESSKYIQTNDIESLKKTLSKIQMLTEEIKKDIEKRESQVIYALIRKNAHWIAIGLVVFIYLGYIISNVFLPYLRYKKILRELVKKEKELVKARIETEKQFFMRKIDEKTFRELIVKRQHEIISTRVKIKEIKNEMKNLVRESLSPVKMILWIKDVLKKLPKIIYSKLKKIKEYGEDLYWRIRFR